MTARKFDNGKPRMELLSPLALREIAKVLTFGAIKYDEWNWAKGLDSMRLLGATLRHLALWQQGETIDPESGLSHLSHAACNLMFMLHLAETMPSMDSRPTALMQTAPMLPTAMLLQLPCC